MPTGAFRRWEIGRLVAIPRRWWSSDKAADSTHCSSDGGTQGRTVTTSSGSSDCSPTAGADETTTDRPLDR